MMKKVLHFGFICMLGILGVIGCSSGSSSSSPAPSPSTAVLSFSKSTLSVTQGSSNNLELLVAGGNISGTVFTVTSSNPTVAALSVPNCQLSSGSGAPHACHITVYGLADGTATITATGSGVSSVSSQITVQNSTVAGTLSFDKSSKNVMVGSSNYVTLKLDNSSGEALNVQLTSNDPSVVTVSPATCTLFSGAATSCEVSLTGVANGTATITANSGSYSATTAVDVTGNVQYGALSFDRTAINVSPDTTTTENLSLIDSSGVTSDVVNLSSSNPSVAVVSPSSCILSSATSSNTCVIDIKGLANGTANITATSSYSGHQYTITPVTVSVTNGLTFSAQAKTVSQTVYNNESYNAQFIFTNTSGSPVTLGQMVITNSGYPLSIQLDPGPCSNVTIAAGSSCTITGSDMDMQNANQITQLNFTLVESGSSTTTYTHTMNIASVINYPGYAAFRLTNHQNPGQQAWLVALGNNGSGQAVVQFNESGIGSLLPESDSYAIGQIQIPSSPLGLVVYQPNYQGQNGNPNGTGIGGLMYVSLESPVYEPAGNIGIPPIGTDYNQYINYSVYEPNVYNSNTGTFLANLDVTAINAVGVTQGFFATDISTGLNQNPGFPLNAYSQLSTESMYTQMQTTLVDTWPTTWGVSAQFLFNPDSPATWVGLRGLVNWIGQDPSVYPTGFDSNIYTQYVDDLWTYYAEPGHQILIDAGEIEPGCVLKASVINSESMLVEPLVSNTCESTATTGPNTWTWSKFQPVDFVGGAPYASNSTLGGANGTYRSMGKYVSAGQSVGFLPYCSQPNFIYGPTSFDDPSVQANYWTAQYSSCLANAAPPPAGYGDSVINQYDKIFHEYIPLIYAWSYDDALGISSEVNIDPTKSVFTLVIRKFSDQ